MKAYGVIMAGGGGTRFWPLSRKKMPKQFLNLTGRETMVNETADRLMKSLDKDDIFVVTNKTQVPQMEKITTGRLKKDHILAEPAARNTAACIGYAAIEILKKYGDGIMCILPSDAYVQDEDTFAAIINQAIETAEKTDKLITVGIKPTFPCTGYGYIKYREADASISKDIKNQATTCLKVEDFVEKPDLETAESYLADGGYAWNSGMFIWKASVILKYFEKLLPDVYTCLQEIEKALGTPEEKGVIEKVYPVIPKISIDYGIMERADSVLMLEGNFGWNDVGSWDTLSALHEADDLGNITVGDHFNIDTTNCIAYAQSKLIATVGVDNLIIVETPDAVLVCAKDRAQDVKNIVEGLDQAGLEQYL
ncbi:MAG: mannose-1-phosphate guanylyltransferase [Lachnospiraceae bacterium]|nr:mannose-1-phosphate guanylyltransferase [Lachnospiraceae bacterium]